MAAKKVDLGPPRTPETGKYLPPPIELKFVVNEAISKRVEDAVTSGTALEAGGITIRAVKPDWANFDWPGEAKVAT